MRTKMLDGPPSTSLQMAVAHIGGQVVTAKKLDVTQQCISRWVRKGFAPFAYARALSLLSYYPAIDLIDPDVKLILDMITPIRK